MRAAIFLDGKIEVGEHPDPVPSRGQALVRTHACGLCAADAHWLHLGSKIIESSRRYGGLYADVDLDRPIVMGHEFTGEIVAYGRGSREPLPIGTRITSIPVVLGEAGHRVIGQAPELPGGFGEYLLVDENFMMAVPAGLDDDLAALTEPLAVGLEHARSGEPMPDDTILVVGCGAIGLGVIAGLRHQGLGPIIASDLDPARRAIALSMGADAAIDPREQSPYEPIGTVSSQAPTLIYECVGAPGMLAQIMRSAGWRARIVVGGFGLEPEQIYIPNGQSKRLKILFAAGEEPQDMELALACIGEGRLDMGAWIGARIGLSEVSTSLLDMRSPGAPVRTVLDPRRL